MSRSKVLKRHMFQNTEAQNEAVACAGECRRRQVMRDGVRTWSEELSSAATFSFCYQHFSASGSFLIHVVHFHFINFVSKKSYE